MIRIPVSYKLNPTAQKNLTHETALACMYMEVIGVVKQLHAIETLEDLLLKTIDETMGQIFKEAGVPVIYSFLETNNGLKREEIADKPDVFSTGMKKLLGSGALVIEKLILKNLYRKLDLKFEEKVDYEFSDYVAELKGRARAQRGG